MLMALTRRRFLSGLSLFAVSAGGCQSVPSGLPDQPTRVTPMVTEMLPPAQGEIIGSGPVRVAMLLPIGGSGNGAKIGSELRNAAQLAIEDFGSDTLQIVVKDTSGQPELALAMATEAMAEGSSALLGPVFAPEVSRIAPALRQSSKIAIAFSSDQTVAGNGIYLNSFLPQGIADRTVTYAFSQGLRTFVALVPKNAAGAVMERQLHETLQTLGGEVLQVERYEPNDGSVQTAAAAIAAKANEAQAIFVPDGGPSPNAIAAALRSNGVDLTGKRLLGTGLWNSSSLADPALAGAWLADVDQARINEFKTRYRQMFGAEPSTNAVLGYDSVSLAVSIVKVHGPVGFTAGVIEARSGFTGYGGVFRFGSDGSNQRAYTVYEIEPGGGRKIVSPSPTSFSGA